MSNGNADTSPVGQRQITRADLEAKFSQLRGSTTASQSQRNVGLAAAILAGLALVLGAYVLGRLRGRKRRTIVEVVRA